jgi:hypothetical protein
MIEYLAQKVLFGYEKTYSLSLYHEQSLILILLKLNKLFSLMEKMIFFCGLNIFFRFDNQYFLSLYTFPKNEEMKMIEYKQFKILYLIRIDSDPHCKILIFSNVFCKNVIF